MKRPGLLVVISAPSGAGKTTLARRLVAHVPEASFSVSCTTRALRGAEQDGIDYHFVTDADFDRMIEDGAFAEWASVHGKRYGTPRATVDEAIAAGRVVVFDIDVQGGEQLQQRYPDAVTIMIVPPSMAELERRLRSRGTDADAEIERRLAVASDEVVRGLRSYVYTVVNADLGVAYADLEAIVRGERCRTARLDTADLVGRA